MGPRIAPCGTSQDKPHTDVNWSPVATLWDQPMKKDSNQSHTYPWYLLLLPNTSTRWHSLLSLKLQLNLGMGTTWENAVCESKFTHSLSLPLPPHLLSLFFSNIHFLSFTPTTYLASCLPSVPSFHCSRGDTAGDSFSSGGIAGNGSSSSTYHFLPSYAVLLPENLWKNSDDGGAGGLSGSFSSPTCNITALQP